jgi:uncharacterized protein (TIGR03435 family)
MTSTQFSVESSVMTVRSHCPSSLTALEAVERLGLKLVKTKGPQEVLTILHAEQPTAN